MTSNGVMVIIMRFTLNSLAFKANHGEWLYLEGRSYVVMTTADHTVGN